MCPFFFTFFIFFDLLDICFGFQFKLGYSGELTFLENPPFSKNALSLFG